MGRAPLLSVAALFLAAAACTAAPKSPTNTPAAVTSATATDAPRTPRERLAQALRSIHRPQPVLDALPLAAQQRLLARYDALDAERKLAVHADDSELVESLPLLHLISGGTSPRALFALATTSAGSEELTGIVGLEPVVPGTIPDTARIAIVRELSQRAALNFLRDRAADVALPGKGTGLVCRLVGRAALAVERRDLVLLARELLADAEPTPDNRLDFARELARNGDTEQAARVASDVSRDLRHAPREGALVELQQAIANARAATAPVVPATDDVRARLQRARAWLHLGRPADARSVLAADMPAAQQRLDLAAAGAEASIDNPSCPGLPPDVGSAQLCALAFRTSDQVKAARVSLEAAWQAGAGRDQEGIEVYVALAHVLPSLQDAAADLSRGALSESESADRVAALRAKIQEISQVAPSLQGLTLFLETVRTGASSGASSLRSDADAKALSARALSLASNDSSRFAQAGVLAVAATLSHQQDISALLDAVPAEQTVPALRVARTALGAWSAVTTGQSWRMDAARAELAATMTALQGSSLERARLVLTVSEADALFDSSQRAYQLLSRVAGQLLNDNIPPDLALRAVLDASGALAHGERFAQAQKLLDGAASADLPPDLLRARDLLHLIRGYKLVLGVHGASPHSLPKARADLAALAAEPQGDAASVWFELWARELQALQADASCAKKKLKVCSEAVALRRDARRGLDARLGASASAVLTRGALPSGSFDAGFRFSIENGLEPLLSFDPAFLAIGLPRVSVE